MAQAVISHRTADTHKAPTTRCAAEANKSERRGAGLREVEEN